MTSALCTLKLHACVKTREIVDLPCDCCQHFTAVYFPTGAPIVLKRLDARYDWLPSMDKFGNRTIPVVPAKDGCGPDSEVVNKIAVVTAGGCSFSKKVKLIRATLYLPIMAWGVWC